MSLFKHYWVYIYLIHCGTTQVYTVSHLTSNTYYDDTAYP
jgi:hypothetical protein